MLSVTKVQLLVLENTSCNRFPIFHKDIVARIVDQSVQRTVQLSFRRPKGACERCVPVVPSCRRCWFGGWRCWLTKWFPTYSLSITRRTPCRPSRFRAYICVISSFRRALISAGYCWNTAKSFLPLPFSNAAVGTFSWSVCFVNLTIIFRGFLSTLCLSLWTFWNSTSLSAPKSLLMEFLIVVSQCSTCLSSLSGIPLKIRLYFILVWGGLHTGASQGKRKEANPTLWFHFPLYIWCPFTEWFWVGDFVDRIYPIRLEVNDTTDTDMSASYLDLHLEIESEDRLRTKFYDKRDDFDFLIVNFPFICSNIPAAPAYGVCISRMIRYSRACCSHQDYFDRGLLLTRKLLNQGFLLVKLKSSLRKFYGRHHDLGWPLWNICVSKWPGICSICRKHFQVLSSFTTYYRVCN